MSLSKLLKYVYQNASDEAIRRGKKIFHTGGAQLTSNDTLTGTARFRVRNDSYYNNYEVKVFNYSGNQKVSTRCNCPYNTGKVCKHEAAALFQLNDLIESGFFNSLQVEYDQKNTMARMRQINEHFLKLFSNAEIMKVAKDLVKAKKIEVKKAEKGTVKADVTEGDEIFPVILKQNSERYFDTSCTCDQKTHPLCVHKVALFLQILKEHGENYFSTIKDWEAQKNKLLSLYGYSLEDDLTGKFEFTFHEGRLVLRVLDRSLKKVDRINAASPAANNAAVDENIRFGVIIEQTGTLFPFVTFQLISGEQNSEGDKIVAKIKRRALGHPISSNEANHKERELINTLRKLESLSELEEHLKRESPFDDSLDQISDRLKEAHPEEKLRKQIWEYYLPRYQNLMQQFEDYPFVSFLPKGESFSKNNFKEIAFSTLGFSLQLKLKKNKTGSVSMSCIFKIGEENVGWKEVTLLNDGLILYKDKLYVADTYETIRLLEEFDGKERKLISPKDWPTFLENILITLGRFAWIDLDESLKRHLPSKEPKLQVELQENDKYLALKPIFIYDEAKRFWLDTRPVIKADEGLLYIQERDMAAEQTFLNILRYIHPDVLESRHLSSFLIPAKEALKSGWYYDFQDLMKKAEAEIVGREQLRELKISPFKPEIKFQISTGIDWFDTEIDLSFGEEHIPLSMLKRALNKGQHFVTLQDDSKGLLTEEWRQKYELLIKMGTLHGGKVLRLKKVHFPLLAGLDQDIDAKDVKSQMADQVAKTISYDFKHPERIDIPQNLKAELRKYQIAGVHWMHFLNKTGWGGILADDMGLGKTIQSLTYLQYHLNQNPNALFLVVCPTTLIYNWENEIVKFTPDIKFKIHHGPNRELSGEKLQQDCNLIITTYGTMRSDKEMLAALEFDYVVLDESQAIKNPNSQIAQAVLLLNSKNRIALSGTPVQNNTFDLFSQMNFLNPGLLGSKEFFRNQFAIPIDKMQEKDAEVNLKKLINPFLLRRTKEQVAPDLPKKTETILYCEMEEEQKKIYQSYRNTFRTKILGEIEEKGIDRSRLSVLTGLMKLRQICDSPAILRDETFDNYSIKIKEIVRELTENTGKHKALVFSQFLGMLSLIRMELDRLKIPYVYFDGSTATTDREKAIKTFQESEDCRVFLISLKAGGVGLNLTAADYVYIIDPWWNPTVEQQAIDRTHRIGQDKNIFAYRLICKETIEEKIILLQERKRQLAKQLIADENSFVKKLTKEDIAYLLSE